jgi:hypothetical protein
MGHKKPELRFFCENCGAEVPLSARHCPHCGREFSQVRCPACGFVGDDSLFKNGCPHCGYNPGTLHGQTPPMMRKSKPSSSSLPFWVYLIMALLFFIAAAIFTYLIFNK